MNGGGGIGQLQIMYYLIRESASGEVMIIYKCSGTPWWPERTGERIEDITQSQYETYVAFGITEATSFEEAVIRMRRK